MTCVPARLMALPHRRCRLLPTSKLISCPTDNVPTTKAIEAEPRIQPYSKGLAPIWGFAVLTANASAIDVVGASAEA